MLFGNSFQVVPLVGGQQVAPLYEGLLVLFQNLCRRLQHILLRDASSGPQKHMVTERLRVEGVYLRPVENEIQGFIRDAFLPFLEHPNNEVCVNLAVDLLKVKAASALIERASGIGEHLGHKVLLAAAEDELHILQWLDVGTKQRLHIDAVIPELLELINGDNSLFVLFLNEIEDCGEGVLLVTV